MKVYSEKLNISKNFTGTLRTDNEKGCKMEPALKEFIEEINGVDSLKKAYAIIDGRCENNPDFKELDLNLFRYKDYFIRTGKALYLQNYADNLKTVSSLGVKCAPKLIYSKTYGDNGDMVLITKVNGAKDSELLDYMEVANNLPMQPRTRLVEDFEILAREGLYNPFISSGAGNWLVTSDKENIYIDDWTNLNHFKNDSEKSTMRKEIRDMCGLLY